MSLRDELLTAIPGDNPGGAELRYDPVFDKIKEARREDDDAPQGDWQSARKTADWPLVIKLTKEALAKKSKDLQIAAWLTEALLRREGFPGFRAGLDLVAGMIERFWDNLYPEIDDGDAEMRAAPLDWIGLKLGDSVRLVPLTRTGQSLLQYKESRTIPTETDVVADSNKQPARDEAQADGKLLPEEFDRAFDGTPKAWYKTLVADVDSTIETLDALEEIAKANFGDAAPSFGKLRASLDEFQRIAQQLLKKKLELDPDPVEMPAEGSTGEMGAASPSGATATGGAVLASEPVSREDASSRIIVAARWLRRNDPSSPAAYLLLRGFRWGELRAGGATVDPKLLEAPTTQTRTHLKGFLLDGKWKELLETAETVMGTPQGRGWLDLQRYALTAIDELGSDYRYVAEAIRGELRALLADLPGLLEMTLMDDTPTANVETRGWLKTVVGSPSVSASTNGGGESSTDDDPEVRVGRDPRSLAQSEVRAGRADRAISLLMREAAREKTKRGRFLNQAELASIMVDAGHVPVAMPILEELVAHIETHKLEEWEDGELVARPLILLYRCLQQTEGDPAARQALYLRICRLDPLQAMSFGAQQSAPSEY
jgi:type VI secretion system protein ImpA